MSMFSKGHLSTAPTIPTEGYNSATYGNWGPYLTFDNEGTLAMGLMSMK